MAMRYCMRAAAAAAALAACATAEPAAHADDAGELIAASQELLDAVSEGDQETWRRIVDPDALTADEDGSVQTGAEVIAQIRPLPAGYVGSLRIVDPHVRIEGDVGIATFEIAETLDLLGQRLNTRYHSTYVFRRADDGWRLIAYHNNVLPSELAPVAIDPAVFADYEGDYRLSAEVSARVWGEGGKLYMQRAGREREELLPIGNDRFVRRGAPRGERFFRRDASGRVVALVDRRDNNDLVWRRD